MFSVLFATVLFGQTNSASKYYYAEVTLHIGGFNKHKSTSISFGTDYSIPVEKKTEISEKVNTLKEGVDIKNYLNEMGWEYVDIVSMVFNDMVVVYTFRKSR